MKAGCRQGGLGPASGWGMMWGMNKPTKLRSEPVALTVKPGRTGAVYGRHPWLFSGALTHLPEGLVPGQPVHLRDESGGFLALGQFSSYGQLAVRIWGYDPAETVDRSFFVRRFRRALDWRLRFLDPEQTNAYRLVAAEGDMLPGLVVDRYADVLVVQFHTRAMDAWREDVLAALLEVVQPAAVYERSDPAYRRQQEDWAPRTGLMWGTIPEDIDILENGLHYRVDVVSGRKTGSFLDQRDKRFLLGQMGLGMRVLNTFSYSGGFSVSALAGGAREVVSVDVSEAALNLARENIRRNGFPLDACRFVAEDVRSFLTTQADRSWDILVLDPPAYIKDRRKKDEGVRGYRSLNQEGARVVSEGGLLLTCSCSAHLDQGEFRQVVTEALGRANRLAQLVASFEHGMDHPQALAHREAGYLKALLLRVF